MRRPTAQQSAALAELATILRTHEDNVSARLIGLKIAPVCTRCGGSGSYSFNQTDGSRCYGCNGRGHVAPKPKDLPDMLEAAKAAAADGRLQTYLRALKARKLVKTAGDRAMAAWKATRVAAVNSAISHMVRDSELDGLATLRSANKRMHDAYERAAKAAYALNPKSPSFDLDVIAVADTVEDAIREIQNADYEPPADLVEHAERAKAERAARWANRGF